MIFWSFVLQELILYGSERDQIFREFFVLLDIDQGHNKHGNVSGNKRENERKRKRETEKIEKERDKGVFKLILQCIQIECEIHNV